MTLVAGVYGYVGAGSVFRTVRLREDRLGAVIASQVKLAGTQKGLHGRRLRALQNGLWLVDKVDCGFDYGKVRCDKAFSREFGRSSVLNRLHDTEGNWPDVKAEFLRVCVLRLGSSARRPVVRLPRDGCRGGHA
jgi:hypothetical protein